MGIYVKIFSHLNGQILGRTAYFVALAWCLRIGAENLVSPPGPYQGTNAVSLEDLLRRVVDNNEAAMMKVLEVEASRKLAKAEYGIFEPAVVASGEVTRNHKENNAQQTLALGFKSELDERNVDYNGGLELLSPTGARLHTGTTIRQLKNNLQTAGEEYETFVGFSLTQPLLKNAGIEPTLVRLRLASIQSEIAFQDYRKNLMLLLAQAEGAYWDLYLLQEQERLANDSLTMAAKILADNRLRSEVGKSPELEISQAQAGVSLRNARESEARSKFYEMGRRLFVLFSGPEIQTNLWLQAADAPVLLKDPGGFYEAYSQAFTTNPDFLMRQKQLAQENIRVAYNKNQRLPQLDLKASYGLNGLGPGVSASYDDVGRKQFATWSVGAELRIPIMGGIKEKNEYEAAEINKKRALLSLKEMQTQMANSLEAALFRIASYRDAATNYQSVADYHEILLKTQLDRLSVGQIGSRDVLETENKVFESKVAVVESRVLYRKALVDLALVKGAILAAHNMEMTREQLHDRTSSMLNSFQLSESNLGAYQNQSLYSRVKSGSQ